MSFWLFLLLLIVVVYFVVQLSVASAKTEVKTAIQSQKAKEIAASGSEEASGLRPISKSEETTLRNCFPWGVYYLQHIDYRPQAILCRGKLRAVPEEAYRTIKKNIEQAFDDRFLVIFQESLKGQPFFALVPNIWSAQNRSKERITRPVLALGLLSITLVTTTAVGAGISGVEPQDFQSDPRLLLEGLPYSLGIIAILGVHELSHYLATVYYKIRATLPYFFPEPGLFLGTFGAFIQMRSPVPNRKALFDISIAGPLGGFIITVPLLIWGLSLSKVVSLGENPNLFDFNALDPRFSFLLAVFSKIALGSQLEPNMALDLHPLAVAGYVGLIVTALNLMPVGQLDGGHIVHAIYGQRTAAVVHQITRLLVFVLALTRPEFLLWAIFLFLMPFANQPALNDVTELDNGRDFLGLFSLALLISILVPVPEMVAQWLNL